MSQSEPQTSRPKYAWLAVPRAGVSKRSAVERLADFLEIYGPYDEATAREQASRCVQCPEPSCVQGCPLGNRIPEWLALTAEGQFSEAAAILHATSCLPEIASRVCPADRLCEGMCILNSKAEPVSIWAIEQFLNEYAFAHAQAQPPTAPPNGLRVAVLGAGPGGLTCADLLSRRGYAVTVFDWRSVPGGLLVSGTPAFRLERAIVQRRIALLEARGVKFQLEVAFDERLSYGQLRAQFDAVFLGMGARRVRELAVPGVELQGVAQALAFLVQEHTDAADQQPRLDVAGQRVVVVGGGDMAMDCLRTALRAGARQAVCVYRRDAGSLPCIRSEYENALEEGVQFVFQAVVQAILGDERGHVRALRCLRTELGTPDAEGRRPFSVLPGTEFELPADRLFLALGFERVQLPADHPFSSLARDPQGGIQVDENQMTCMPGVFAGGDLVRGPSTVLNLVRDARRAAEGIDRYLQSRLRAGVAK